MKCAVCEFNFDDNAAKCPFCGHGVGAAVTASTPVPAPEPEAIAPPAGEPATTPQPATQTPLGAMTGATVAPPTAPPTYPPTDPQPYQAYPSGPTIAPSTGGSASSSGIAIRFAVAAFIGVILGTLAFVIVLLRG